MAIGAGTGTGIPFASLFSQTARAVAPVLPHEWECGHMFEEMTRTLFCGDLLTQFGADRPPLTENDILEPSEQARAALDYYAHGRQTGDLIERLAARNPAILACMHGPAWRGDGATMLRAHAERLTSA